MGILKSIFKGGIGNSDTASNSGADGDLSLEQSKARIEELRRSVSGLKKRHERSIELKAATCNTKRSIEKLQSEISRLKRRYPSIASAHQDSYKV